MTTSQGFTPSPTPSSTPSPFGTDHEQVVFCQDPASGLKAIIAIYSTQLGPALGGTRFHPYTSEAEALADVLDLAKGMAYKSALAGLDLGGGKAVIIGDPKVDKNEAMLRAYGRFVQSLNGRYFTACDVGTYSTDMDLVARECDFVVGRTTAHGGSGDSSVATAFGVHQGMRAAAQFAWGDPSLAGKRVGVAGVGKVGRHLVDHLIEDDARVVVTDIDADAISALRDVHPGIEIAASTDALIAANLDVYAPCALGGALNESSLEILTAKVVAGAANNQLADPHVAKLLADRGIVYAPDYCINAGGVIQVFDELDPSGFSVERTQARTTHLFDATLAVLERAASEGITTAEAADRQAETRMREIGRLSQIRV